MKSLTWIRMLAYSECAAFERHKIEDEERAATVAEVERRLAVAELRFGIVRELKAAVGRAPSRDRMLHCINDGSEEGFVVCAMNGHLAISALSLTRSDAGLRCCYWAIDRPDHSSPEVHVAFGTDGAITMTSSPGGTAWFASNDAAAGHLLKPLLAVTARRS
jgi:hypothetical protein